MKQKQSKWKTPGIELYKKARWRKMRACNSICSGSSPPYFLIIPTVESCFLGCYGPKLMQRQGRNFQNITSWSTKNTLCYRRNSISLNLNSRYMRKWASSENFLVTQQHLLKLKYRSYLENSNRKCYWKYCLLVIAIYTYQKHKYILFLQELLLKWALKKSYAL